MSSFQKLWENIQLHKENHVSHDDKAMSAIRTGNGVDENFWENFLLVINNADDLSELLDVPVTKISTWYEKINHVLDRVKSADSDKKPSSYRKLLKTGQPEAQDDETITNSEQS